jgi:hypothetical protein
VTTDRTISAQDFVKDLRSRMTDAQLMDKYRLSAVGLERVLKKLFDAKLITQSELDWRPVDYEDTVILDLDFLPRDR